MNAQRHEAGSSLSRPLAVVTGGSGGIGRAVAARLLASGHQVMLTGRKPEALAEAAAALSGAVSTLPGAVSTLPGAVSTLPGAVSTLPGAGILTAAFDVADEAAVAEHLGGLDVDVLVNNAGYANSAPLHKMALADWQEMLSVHATGAFLCTRAVLGGMRTRNRGRIVTVSSVAGVAGARYIAGYVAAKHASIGLMRATAAEVAGTGVTANAVCPAYVDTPMTDHSVANISGLTGQSEESAREGLAKLTSLGRLVTPDEVAAAVAYLASPEAGAVNGQTLVIDGGGMF